MLPLVMLALGLSWLLAAMGVFVRDVGPSVTLALSLLMFVTPVFFDQNADWIPRRVKHLLLLNPLATILDTIRGAVLWDELPRWRNLFIVFAGSTVVMMIGYAGFMKSRKAFSDVI
jgi:lipopolysaccharide transport system permease protein